MLKQPGSERVAQRDLPAKSRLKADLLRAIQPTKRPDAKFGGAVGLAVVCLWKLNGEGVKMLHLAFHLLQRAAD